MFIYTFIAVVLVMLTSLSGVIFVSKTASDWMHRNLSLLVSFSAGVFLVVSLTLLTETLETLSVPVALGLFLLGFIVIGGIFSLIPHSHHHHDEHCDHDRIDPRRILASDGLHNIGDGILIAASFAAGPVLGITSTLSVLVHEIVQEVSEFFVLRESGYSIKKALGYNFVVSGTILVGALAATFFINQTESFEAPILAFSGGAFLYTVIKDLIPHSIRNSKEKQAFLDHFIWFLVGITVLLTIQAGFGHSHDDSHDHIDDEAHIELGHWHAI